MRIEDGTGNGYSVKVTSDKMLRTYAQVESEMSHQSESHGMAYSWSHAYNYTGVDTILWLRNDNTTKNLVIQKIIIAGDTSTQFTIHSPTGTTQLGTAVTGVNLNRGSGNVALATAIGDETGNTQANIIGTGFIIGSTTTIMPVDGGIILQYLDEIAVDFVTTGAMGAVTIIGYYHEID